MAYQIQLIDAKNSIPIRNVAGCSPSSDDFTALINEAQRRLAKRGNFYGMTQRMQLVFQGNCIAWPREVGTILGVRKCREVFPIRNNWYAFTGDWTGSPQSFGADTLFEDIEPGPVFDQIYGAGNGVKLIYQVADPNDVGKGITVFGRKYGFYPLQEHDASGNTIDGLTIQSWGGTGGFSYELGRNIVPKNAAYPGPNGVHNRDYLLDGLTIGQTYLFVQGENDALLIDGSSSYLSGYFTASATSVYLESKYHLTAPVDPVPITAKVYPVTPVMVTQIDAITRDATQGMAYLYQYDATTNQKFLLAAYYPSDTKPHYRRSIIRGFCAAYQNGCSDNNGTTPVYNRIEVLAKLKFIPASSDRDFLLVDDIDALKFAVQAVKAEEANDHATAETLITKAIRELNFRDRDMTPNNQTSIAVNATLHSWRTVNPN